MKLEIEKLSEIELKNLQIKNITEALIIIKEINRREIETLKKNK